MKRYRFLISIIVGTSLCLIGYQSAFAQGEQGSGNGQPFQTLQSHIDLLSTDLDAAVADLQMSSPPVGSVVAFAGPSSSVPKGWLLCDGSAVDSTLMANKALFAVIGESHGDAGDGAGLFFNLPDYRGRFLRGVDAGAARDPDSGTRTAMNSGGNTGDLEGSVQGDATALPNASFGTSNAGSHNHTYNDLFRILHNSRLRTFVDENHLHASGGTQSASRSTNFAGGHAHSVDTGGDLETRPSNAYVNWIIRAR